MSSTTPQSLRERIAIAASQTHRAPTQSQREAGNYPKGKFAWNGHEIAIETPKGSIRTGQDRAGTTWKVTMPAHYGYIRRTVSDADGDAVDVIVGPHPESDLVCVVDQVTAGGRFDEHKVVIGCLNVREARELYLACYSSGWRGLKSITPMTRQQFSLWLKKGDTARPIMQQVTRKYSKQYSRVELAAARYSLEKSKENSERWITIHPHGHEEGTGTPVKIDGRGNIVGGPKGIADKGIKKLSDFGGKGKGESGGEEKPATSTTPKYAPEGYESPQLKRNKEIVAALNSTEVKPLTAKQKKDKIDKDRQSKLESMSADEKRDLAKSHGIDPGKYTSDYNLHREMMRNPEILAKLDGDAGKLPGMSTSDKPSPKFTAKGNEIFDAQGVRHGAFRNEEKAKAAADEWNKSGKPGEKKEGDLPKSREQISKRLDELLQYPGPIGEAREKREFEKRSFDFEHQIHSHGSGFVVTKSDWKRGGRPSPISDTFATKEEAVGHFNELRDKHMKPFEQAEKSLNDERESLLKQERELTDEPAVDLSSSKESLETSGKTPEDQYNQLPNAVQSHVKFHLGRLQQAHNAIVNANKLGARYGWEVADNPKLAADVAESRAKLDSFRKMAGEKGIDAESVLSHVGGEPSRDVFDKAQAWGHESTKPKAPSTSDRAELAASKARQVGLFSQRELGGATQLFDTGKEFVKEKKGSPSPVKDAAPSKLEQIEDELKGKAAESKPLAGQKSLIGDDDDGSTAAKVEQQPLSSKRLETLKASLEKKEAVLDSKFDAHFADVKRANGQPLNDKRNGQQTLNRWEKQSNSIRAAQEDIEKTKQAIQRETGKLMDVAAQKLPDAISEAVKSGGLTQWRKYPNRFFVPGVDKARIIWNEKEGKISHQYVSQIPKEQYPIFRDAFNNLHAALKKSREAEQQEPEQENYSRASLAAARITYARETRPIPTPKSRDSHKPAPTPPVSTSTSGGGKKKSGGIA